MDKNYISDANINNMREIEKEAAEFNKQMKKSKRTISLVVILFVALIIMLMSMVVTEQDEYSVVKQFGSIVRVESEPGVSWKIPIIQNVTKVDKQILYYDIAPSDVITSDKKTMIVDAYVLWRISDAEKFISSLSGSNTNAEGRLNTTTYNAIKNTISGMTQNEVILSRDGKIDVSVVDEESITNDIVTDDDETDNILRVKSLTEEIAANLASTEDYGIEIVVAEVKMLDLPDANKEAVYQRMISERNNVAGSYEAQGQSDAQMIINTTNKEIAIMKSEAYAKAESIIAEGEAEYMRILSEAYNDESKSEFYSFVRALDAAKASLNNGKNTLILNEDSPISQIFYKK